MSHWFSTAHRFKDPVGARRIATYVDLLSRFPVGHLADIGAGHGTFSRIAADMGWRVTAVDVRSQRFPDDDRITWVTQDVRRFDRYDDVDLVVCLGLWYHLTLTDQRQLAKRVAPRPMILDTHVATPTIPTYSTKQQPRISDIVRRGGFQGRFFSEKGLQRNATASWGNELSFWPSIPSLERQMWDAGYEIFEQISPPYLPDRGFFVARKLGSQLDGTTIDDFVRPWTAETAPGATPAPEPLPSLVPEPAAGLRASTKSAIAAAERAVRAQVRKRRG
jgi:hypothetical protein